MAYTTAWHHTGFSTIAFVQTFLILLGRLRQSGFTQKADPAKKKRTRELFVVHQADVVALVVMASLPLSMCSRLAIAVMVSLPLLMCRRLHSCQASVVTLVACCQAGVVALIVMSSLLLICRLCCCCSNNCCSCHNGIIAVIDVRASLPLLR
jgi:hypothetical protein